MDFVTTLPLLLTPDGLWVRVGLAAAAWVAVATAGHLLYAFFLLRRFSREGPVIPLLLPPLQERWQRSYFAVVVWEWLRRVGLLALLLCVVGAGIDIGTLVWQTLSADVVSPSWQADLAAAVRRLEGTLALLAAGIAIRAVVGGIGSLVIVRARGFVTASASLVSREDLERARRFLGEVQAIEEGQGGAKSR
jgi:hypothetical protein